MIIDGINLNEIRRPKLLMSAAKTLVAKRKLDCPHSISAQQDAVKALVAKEADLENLRQANTAVYRVDKHIEVLADIIIAAQTLKASRSAELRVVN